MANDNNINPNTLITLGIVGLIFIGGKKLLEVFHLGNSPGDAANLAKIEKLKSSNVFSPNYYKQFTRYHILTDAGRQLFAKTIYDAKGVFNDDESAVYGVFRQIKYKTAVSYLAEYFFSLYKQDLFGYLQGMFNDAEMANVADIVNSLPTGNT